MSINVAVSERNVDHQQFVWGGRRSYSPRARIPGNASSLVCRGREETLDCRLPEFNHESLEGLLPQHNNDFWGSTIRLSGLSSDYRSLQVIITGRNKSRNRRDAWRFA
jgi:hypothetical protein